MKTAWMKTTSTAFAHALRAPVLAAALFAVPCRVAATGEATVVPAELPAIGSIDERFQSFNVEMAEVTGGSFWKPYSAGDGLAKPDETVRSAESEKASLFADRSPIDLTSKLLRKLASALAPALMRVSGTCANPTFFADAAGRPPQPPAGYKGVLTGDRWREVIAFSKAIDAPIVTSFAIGPPMRHSL